MILRKETETSPFHNFKTLLVSLIRMNDTPQGDGNLRTTQEPLTSFIQPIRMNDTPQGDGNML